MKDETGAEKVRTARRLAILAVIAWFAAAVAAGVSGIVNVPGRPPLALAGLLAIPIVGFVTAYRTSASFRAFTETIPLALLVGSHVWRFVGLGFVLAWAAGALPAGFGIPEGFGDIIAATGALLLLPAVRRGTASRGWLLAWNAFGFLDLVSAITVGILYSEGPAGILGTPTSNTALMVTFPVSLIPTFFVPLFLLAHALTFRRLVRRSAPDSSWAASRGAAA
ncbi:MAG: hypothetical protein ACM3SU_08830 [Acidobacteriota bacterium]